MTDLHTVLAEQEQAAAARDGNTAPQVETILEQTLGRLTGESDNAALEGALREFAAMLTPLDDLERAMALRSATARLKDLGVDGARDLVLAALKARNTNGTAQQQGQVFALRNVDPWPEPVGGDVLLAGLVRTFARFVVLPAGGATALALWTLHAHSLDAAQCSPLLVFTSPEKRCGKSTSLTVLRTLVPRPMPAASISPAALFRAIEKYRPTLLLDEAETAFRQNEELRAVVNAAHFRPMACVVRTVGDDHEPRMFSTWCPKAVALIGKLPGTLGDRAITLNMRRRAGEQVEKVRLDRLPTLEPLQRQAARWARDHHEVLKGAEPAVPAELHDRAADNWRPLLAIADAAGGEWPGRAREAARRLSGGDDADAESPGILLLADLRDLFADRGVTRLSTTDILAHLNGLETRPWPEWKDGRTLSSRQLAKLLERFEIGPRTVRDGGERFKGYQREQFDDAFARYLPPQSVTSVTSLRDNDLQDSQSVTPSGDVTDTKSRNPSQNAGCHRVTDWEGGTGGAQAVARERLAGQTITPELLGAVAANPPAGVEQGAWWDALDAVTRTDGGTAVAP